MHRRLLVLAAMALVVALLTACGQAAPSSSPAKAPEASKSAAPAPAGAATPAPAKAPEKPRVSIKAAVSGYDAYLLMAPIHVAAAKGYFKDAGLDVEILTTGGGGDTIRAVTTGGMQIAVGGADASISAVVKGQPITLVSPYWQTTDNAWIVPSDSPIKAINDIEGKSLGFTSPGSSTEFMAREAVKQAGLKNVKMVAIGGEGNSWAAVKSKQLDVSWAIEPLLTMRIRKDGARVVWYAQKYVPHFMMDAIVVHNDFLKSNPEAVKGFLGALIKGMDFTKNNGKEAAEIAAKVLKVEAAILEEGLKNEPNRDVGMSFKVDPLAFKTIEKGMLENKSIPEAIKDWDKVFNQSFLPENLRVKIPTN